MTRGGWAAVLLLSPLGGADMTRWCGGWAARQGDCVKVATSDWDSLSVAAVQKDGRALRDAVAKALATPGDVILFAHSRGCVVVGEWLALWSDLLSDEDAERVRIVMTGNLERPRSGFVFRKGGRVGNSVRTTPEGTRFAILDIGRKGDKWALCPRIVFSFQLMLCAPHNDYSRVNPDALQPLSQHTVGLTRYVTVP